MQIYDKDFHHKGLSKSHSSYFSPNPDNRGKNEVSFQKKKNREREEEHLQIRGEKLVSPNESNISFKMEGKKECSCRGTNLNCYKCNGSGFVEKNYINPLLIEPVNFPENKNSSSNTQATIIKLTTKKVLEGMFKCPYCELKYEKNSSLKIHIENVHKSNNIKIIKASKPRIIKEKKNLLDTNIFDKKTINKNIAEKIKNKNEIIPSKKLKESTITDFKPKKDGLKIVNKINKKDKPISISDLASKGWTIK